MGGTIQSSSRKSSYDIEHEIPSEFFNTSPTANGASKDKTAENRTNVDVNHFLMPKSYSTDLHEVTTNALHLPNKLALKFNGNKKGRANLRLRRWKYRSKGYGIINELSSDESDDEKRKSVWKLKDICNTIESLERSLKISRSLEAEQWLRYSKLKAHDMIKTEDLKKSYKLNKNMLNLFRQSVTDIRFGNNDTLPESLKREVQRSWHQKYDALLKKNEQLEKEMAATNFINKEKDKQIETLQQKLLNLAETKTKREEIVNNMNLKYLYLKNRKEEQEVLFRGTIENLQMELQKTKNEVTLRKSETVIPSKNSLLEREVRRNERLTHENSILRALLHQARRSCKNCKIASAVEKSS